MPAVIVCTVCSRTKKDDHKLLPAQERYLGGHIAKVGQVAADEDVPFFILSGVYGLIPALMPIPYYDHLLQHDDLPMLAGRVYRQLGEQRIQELYFYTKATPAWQQYGVVLARACEKRDVRLHRRMMPLDA